METEFRPILNKALVSSFRGKSTNALLYESLNKLIKILGEPLRNCGCDRKRGRKTYRWLVDYKGNVFEVYSVTTCAFGVLNSIECYINVHHSMSDRVLSNKVIDFKNAIKDKIKTDGIF